MTAERHCKCGKPLGRVTRKRIHCSDACKYGSPSTCAVCGKSFMADRRRLARGCGRFCSSACHGRHVSMTGERSGPGKSGWKHGRSRIKDRTYGTWKAMIKRCANPACIGYEAYGGRGITVCDRWRDSFESFLADMGEKPIGLSIDRIDNDGNYEPGNCRWATPLQQARNSRRYRLKPHHRIQIGWLRSCGMLQREIGEALGFGQATVSQVLVNSALTAASRSAERNQVVLDDDEALLAGCRSVE